MNAQHASDQPTVEEIGTLRVEAQRHGDSATIAFVGELDLAGSELAEQFLVRAQQSDAAEVVVDLSRLEFVDSSGIRVMLEANARSRGDGQRLAFKGVDGQVARVLEMTGVAKMLELE